MRSRQRHSNSTTSLNNSSITSLKRRRVVPRPLPFCLFVLVFALLVFCLQLFYFSGQERNDIEISRAIVDETTRTLQSYKCSNTTSIYPRKSRPDIPAACRKRWYRTRRNELPRAELVIAADKQTCPASILRTVALALLHTKSGLLKKVWVSTSISLPDDIVDALQMLPETTILYRPEMATINALRNEGAEYVRSPALVFLTPGVLPAQSWLEPLLGEIAQDEIKGRRITVALPADSPERRGASPPTVGHDWALRRLLFSRVHTSGFASEANAAQTPLMPHGDFAVSTKYWQAIGGYDDVGDTELAFRIWQCGGSVAIIPCSRVYRPNGGNFELRGPVKHLPDGLTRQDRLRVARRWMGPYSILAEFANGEYPNSTQLKVSEEGQCPSDVYELIKTDNNAGYREYMGAAFPEMQPSAQIMLGTTPKLGLRAWGKLRLVGENICVTLENRKFVTAKCEHASVLVMSRSGYMMAAPRLTATCVTRKDGHLDSNRCDIFMISRQNWEIETRRETSVFARVDGEPVCLTALSDGELAVTPCSPESETRQTWIWQFRASDDAVGEDRAADERDNTGDDDG